MRRVSDIDVIEKLDAYGFSTRKVASWRGENPDDWDAYPVDIGDLPSFDRDERSYDVAMDEADAAAQWVRVAEQLDIRNSGSAWLPPPVSVDALAWYLPIHYFGPDWGIYIREDSIIEIAASIRSHLPQQKISEIDAQKLVRLALSVLYLHEAFHHKVESFATRLEMSRLQPVFIPYEDQVYRPLRGTDDHLEEAFACSEMYSRLDREKSFNGGVGRSFKHAALAMLRSWIPTLPPGYRLGLDAMDHFHIGELLSQVAAASPTPSQPPEDWDIANHMIRGIFHKNSVAQVIVPVGARPMIPWLGADRYLSLSSRNLERHIVRDFGYRDTGRGKGSHRHFHCEGRDPITLPTNRESLSPGVQRQAARALGYPSIRDLAAHC